MSGAMDMAHKIRTEASITIGDYIFDINLVNHHGWIGNNKYDVNELEIVKKQTAGFAKGELFILPNNNIESYNINKIKEGYWDKFIEMHGFANYHSQIIGIHLDLYKEAIAKFEKLKAFI